MGSFETVFIVADAEVVDHDNAEIGFMDDVDESHYGFTNYRKEVDDHGKTEVGFIGNIVESDDDLTDNDTFPWSSFIQTKTMEKLSLVSSWTLEDVMTFSER
ncbi:hypothetical protein GJ496_003680 [Pomphorhynchus laevis]|nr:hypothetical protein GJ496_003680 [Pomphorhynchus laevis]